MRSNIEPEMHYIAIPDDVLLALQPHLARLLRTLFAPAGYEVVITDDFGTDEAFLEIGMDHGGGLGGL